MPARGAGSTTSTAITAYKPDRYDTLIAVVGAAGTMQKQAVNAWYQVHVFHRHNTTLAYGTMLSKRQCHKTGDIRCKQESLLTPAEPSQPGQKAKQQGWAFCHRQFSKGYLQQHASCAPSRNKSRVHPCTPQNYVIGAFEATPEHWIT